VAPSLPQVRPSAWHPTSPLAGEGELANEGRVSGANPWPKLVRGKSSFLSSTHTSSFTRRKSVRGLTMHVSRSLRFGKGDRPGHGSVPQLVTSLRRPLRHASVPRFGVSIRELATLLPPSCLSGQGTDMCALRRASGAKIGVAAAIPRGWPLSRTPGMGLCVVSPYQAPVPPRRIAMRGSRCGTKEIIAWCEGAGKIGVSGLISIGNARKFLGGVGSFAYYGRTGDHMP
jgi:hypothetical protein